VGRGGVDIHAPEYVDSAFLLHDLGVVELREPIVLPEYATLPEADYLDRYAGSAKEQARFESVGYGLEGSSPKTSFGGDTRRKADRRLVSFKGAYGYRDIAVVFSHARGGSTTGGTCFGDSGGPTFDISTPAIAEEILIVAVTSFGLNYNCNASGSYRLTSRTTSPSCSTPRGRTPPEPVVLSRWFHCPDGAPATIRS